MLAIGIAMAVAVPLLLREETPQPQNFDRSVQRQLASGAWAVVVHDVPGCKQAEIVALLQHTGAAWSAAATPLHRL